MKKILNLGSGQLDIADSVSIDINSFSSPDIVHDLNKTPYPLKTDTFEEVYCLNILEHLEDLFPVMQEIHRVTKSGGKIIIESPHFSCVNAFCDPSHRHFFSIFSFDYFTGGNEWSYYVKNQTFFKYNKRKIVFRKGLLSKQIGLFFNKHPKLYESRFCFMIPAEKIELELEVVKNPTSH